MQNVAAKFRKVKLSLKASDKNLRPLSKHILLRPVSLGQHCGQGKEWRDVGLHLLPQP